MHLGLYSSANLQSEHWSIQRHILQIKWHSHQNIRSFHSLSWFSCNSGGSEAELSWRNQDATVYYSLNTSISMHLIHHDCHQDILDWSTQLPTRWHTQTPQYCFILQIPGLSPPTKTVCKSCINLNVFNSFDHLINKEYLPTQIQHWQYQVIHIVEHLNIGVLIRAFLKWHLAVHTFYYGGFLSLEYSPFGPFFFTSNGHFVKWCWCLLMSAM